MSLAVSVAKELVRLSFAEVEADPLTDLRLQKLLYYAQAWSLVVRGSELFPEELVAWRHGPVVVEVYKGLPQGQGASVIPADEYTEQPDLLDEEKEFVGRVWDSYKEHSAIRLARMTHDETPWKNAWGDRPRADVGNDPILVDDMEEYFSQQTMPAALAEYEHRLRKREEEACHRLTMRPKIDVARLLPKSLVAGG